MAEQKELTSNELTTVISRFQSTIYKLEKTGDYPERKQDKIIFRKLINMKWKATKKEQSKCLKDTKKPKR